MTRRTLSDRRLRRQFFPWRVGLVLAIIAIVLVSSLAWGQKAAATAPNSQPAQVSPAPSSVPPAPANPPAAPGTDVAQASAKSQAQPKQSGGRVEGAEGQAMDLFACVASALEHHAALRAARQDVLATRAKVDQAVARRRPRVDSQWGYVGVEKDPYFDIAGMGTIVFGEKSNYFGNISLQVPLYTGGALEAMEEQARQQTRAASENYQRSRQTLAADAARAYYRALTARRFIDVMQRQVRAVEEALRVAQAMYDQGLVAKLDVLRPQVALSGAQAMLRKTQNQYQVALEALRHAVGLPPGRRVNPVEADVELPLPNSTDEAVKIAWRQRPEVRQLQAYRRAALAGARAALAQKKPTVGVQLTWDAQRTTLMPMYGDWQAAVVIKQNLFDGDLARNQAREAHAQADKLAAKLDELHSGIAVEVRNALATVQAARDQVETRRKAVAAAEEAYRLAMLGYRNEVTPMLDVLQAQAALTEARASLETAKYDLNMAIVDAYLALGQIPTPPTK